MANYGSVNGQQVYYDSKSGQYYTQAAPGTNPLANSAFAAIAAQQARNNPKNYITGPFGGYSQAPQQTAGAPITAPTSYAPQGLQIYGAGNVATPYQRPVNPNPVSQAFNGFRPQFDSSFIQQILAQRGQGQFARPTGAPTLTPGAAQNYGGYQGLGGLAALRGISAGNTGGSNA